MIDAADERTYRAARHSSLSLTTALPLGVDNVDGSLPY